MNHGSLRKIFTLAILLVLCLCGCERQKKASETGEAAMPESGEGMKNYDVSFQTISESMNGEFYKAKLYGKRLYFRSYDEEEAAWIIKRLDAENNETTDPMKWNGDGDEEAVWSVYAFDVMQNGHVLALRGRHPRAEGGYPGKAEKYVLNEFDENGAELWSREIEGDLMIGDVYSPRMGVDGSGNVCLEAKGSLLLVSDGKQKGEIKLDEGTAISEFARSTDGTLFVRLYAGFQSEVFGVNFQTMELNPLEGLPKNLYGIGEATGESSVAAGNVLLVTDEDGIFAVDVLNKKARRLITWSDVGIRSGTIRNVAMHGERIYAYCNENGKNGEIATLKPHDDASKTSQAQGPKVIKVAVIKKYTVLSNLVSDYNRSQNNYRVEVVEYGKNTSTSMEWQDPINRMMADVLGDDPPDLMDVSPLAQLSLTPSLEDLVEKNYVEDLTAYLKNSQSISKEDFEPKVIEAFSREKKIPAIPTSYCIDTVLVPRQEFGEGMGWKLADLMAYDKARPDVSPLENCNRWDIYLLCVEPNIFHFIDVQKGTACFDCKEFREMMEYAVSYPKGEARIRPYTGNQFLASITIHTLFGLEYAQKAYFGKNAGLIGYPTLDGKPLTIIKPDSDSVAMAICSRSSDKEGAWDFVEYVLQQNPRKKSQDYVNLFGGIPTNRRILQETMDELASSDGPFSRGMMSVAGAQITEYGEPFSEEESDAYFNICPLTERDEKLLRELLDAAQVYDQDYKTIKGIVWSECKEYFDESKKLDQVVDAIQNRVQLYLNEREYLE